MYNCGSVHWIVAVSLSYNAWQHTPYGKNFGKNGRQCFLPYGICGLYVYIYIYIYIYMQAINLHNKLFYYLDPYGPSRGVRSVYNALVLVLNFTTNLLVNCYVF